MREGARGWGWPWRPACAAPAHHHTTPSVDTVARHVDMDSTGMGRGSFASRGFEARAGACQRVADLVSHGYGGKAFTGGSLTINAGGEGFAGTTALRRGEGDRRGWRPSVGSTFGVSSDGRGCLFTAFARIGPS